MYADAGLDLHGLGGVRVVVEAARDDPAALQHVHQHARPLQRLHGRGGADALLEPARGLGADAQLAGGDAVVGPLEGGALEQHGGGVVHDLALLAAHDARKAGGVLPVGDDQHRLVQLVGLAVQRGQRLAGVRPAHDDGLVLHLGKVEGVHRVAGLQHHEVGDVHDVVDGPYARAVQVFPHPLGAGADLHVGDDPRAVAGAKGLVPHLDLRVVGKRPLAGLLDGDLGHHEVLLQHRAGFPGQPPHAQAVGPVGQYLKVDDVVAEAEDFLHVGAGGHVLGDFDDPGVADVRVQPRGHVQLWAGAQHAHGHLAAHLALLDLHTTGQMRAVQRHRHVHIRMDVRRAADDLQRLPVAHVHHADVQVVGIGVVHAGQHAPHDHLVKLGAGLLHALHRRAGHHHPRSVFLRGHIYVNILPEPLHGHFHKLYPPFLVEESIYIFESG